MIKEQQLINLNVRIFKVQRSISPHGCFCCPFSNLRIIFQEDICSRIGPRNYYTVEVWSEVRTRYQVCIKLKLWSIFWNLGTYTQKTVWKSVFVIRKFATAEAWGLRSEAGVVTDLGHDYNQRHPLATWWHGHQTALLRRFLGRFKVAISRPPLFQVPLSVPTFLCFNYP